MRAWLRRLVRWTCPVFGGGDRDAPDKLRRDHSGSEFRNKIIDQIEQSAQETCGKIQYSYNT